MDTHTCQVDIAPPHKLPVFCGQPAKFRFIGSLIIKPGETQAHAMERRGRSVTDLCMDHSREKFITFEPFLKTGQVTMQCLEFTKLTLLCTSCHSLFRFEPLRPYVVRGIDEQSKSDGYFPVPHHFCPACGSPAVAEANPELDFWEIMAEQLGIPEGAAITREIHSHWIKDRTATSKFVEYIQSIMREMDDAEQGS